MSCDQYIPINNLYDLWNASGANKVAIRMDVNDVSSSANSKLIDLLVSGLTKFYVNKSGVIQTASNNIWIRDPYQHGFGITSSSPSIYVSGSPLIVFTNSGVCPVNSNIYDLGARNKLFKNIYQTTTSNSIPTTGNYPHSGSWGIHRNNSNKQSYIAYNNGTGIDYLSFDILVSTSGLVSTGTNNGLITAADNKLFSTNFANTNLTFNGSRTHNLNNNILQIDGNNGSFYFFPTSLRGLTLTTGTQSLGQVTLSNSSVNVLSASNTVRIISSGVDLVPTTAFNTNLSLRFFHLSSTGFFVSLRAPSLTKNTIFTLPTGDGISGQALVTDGLGNLNFKDVASTSFTGVSVSNSISGNGYTVPLSISISTDSGNIANFGIDGKLYVPSTDKFTNSTAMPQTIGGLNAGTTFDNIPLTGLINNLLYPYQSPSFSSFSFNQTTPLEVGNTISAGVKTFNWATTNSSNISPNTIIIEDVTSSLTLGSNLSNDGSENISISSVQKTSATSHIWRITATNTNSISFNRTFSVVWQWAIYYGESNSNILNEAEIESLRVKALGANSNGNYAFLAGGYKYICYPTSMGLKTTFIDQLTQLNVGMENPYIINITNTYGISTDYYVHRTTNILNSNITIVVSN